MSGHRHGIRPMKFLDADAVVKSIKSLEDHLALLQRQVDELEKKHLQHVHLYEKATTYLLVHEPTATSHPFLNNMRDEGEKTASSSNNTTLE